MTGMSRTTGMSGKTGKTGMSGMSGKTGMSGMSVRHMDAFLEDLFAFYA